MTRRAILIGFIGALFVAGLGYINNYVLKLNPFELGYLLPVGVAVVLMLCAVVLNPLLFRLRPTWAFSPSELAVIVLMVITALTIPGRGLMERFTGMLATPVYWGKMKPVWAESEVLSYTPASLIVAPGEPDAAAIQSLVSGRPAGTPWIGLKEIPWRAWLSPLSVWVPFILLFSLSSVCLALIVHAQWAKRERLQYPIATVLTTLLDRNPNDPIGSIYRNRFFWIGTLVVFGIYLVNGLDRWLQTGIRIPLEFSFAPIAERWPHFFNYPQSGYLMRVTIYPMVIGLSYFLASDVALTLGLSQYLMALVYIPLLTYGVPVFTDYLAGGLWGWERAGAYVAFALALIYTGRHHYRQVLQRGLLFRRAENVGADEAWACRLFVLCVVAMTLILAALGVSWTVGLIAVLLMLIMFLCVSRIAAETGLFWIHSRWAPLGALLGFMGGYAFGPTAMIVVGMLSAVLCIAPDVGLLPLFANSVRTCEDVGVRPGKAAWLSMLTYVIVLGVALVVVLWANYNFGIPKDIGWGFEHGPALAFNPAIREVTTMRLAGTLEESVHLGPLQRFLRMNPDRLCLWSAGVGFGSVLLLSFLRLRFPWWRLHPVLMLVIATAPMSRFNHSFMMGWAIKSSITRWGGHGVYERLRPLMIGLVVGDLLGTGFLAAVGTVYFLVTGQQLPQYHAIGI